MRFQLKQDAKPEPKMPPFRDQLRGTVVLFSTSEVRIRTDGGYLTPAFEYFRDGESHRLDWTNYTILTKDDLEFVDD